MKNFNVAQAIAFGDGDGGEAALSFVEAGIIRNLKQSQVILLRSGLSGSWVDNATKRYSLGVFPKAMEYNKTTNTKQIPQIKDKFIHLEHRENVAVEIEDFDLINLSSTLSPIVSQFIANMTSVADADLKYWFYKGQIDYFVGVLVDNVRTNPHYENTLFLPELVEEKVLSQDKLKFLQKSIVWAPAKMSKKFNEHYMMIPTNEFVGVVDNFGAINIESIFTGLNYSAKQYDALENGYVGRDNGQMFKIGGLALLIDGMLNNDIAKAASFNNDYKVDFATLGFIGSIHHQDCMLYPTTPYVFKRSVSNDNGNDIVFLKYESGFGIAYEDLCLGIFNKLFVFTNRDSNGEYIDEVKVGENLQLYTNASNTRTIAWTSSDDTKATVSGGKVVGVAQGDVVITATITDTSLSGSPFTATYNVSVIPANNKK